MNKHLSSSAVEFCQLLKQGQFSNGLHRVISNCEAELIAKDIFTDSSKNNGNIYIIGNGGSSAIASHIITDFRNVAHLRALTLHESSVLTCFSNDYGYENAYVMQLEKIARTSDVLIALSSSGESKNILNAAQFMQNIGAKVVTFSGFSQDNPLRRLGNLNYWISSNNYGLVEIAHLFVLHHWVDYLASSLSPLADLKTQVSFA